MELKLTKEQEELLLKNYKEECKSMENLPFVAKATAKNFLLGCLDEMLSKEEANKIFGEVILDTTLATVESALK